jgi:hypothetical protein
MFKIYYLDGIMMRELTILYHKYTAVALTLGLVAVSASTFVSGAYAQAGGHGAWLYGHSSQLGQTNVKVLGQELTQGIKAQVGPAGLVGQYCNLYCNELPNLPDGGGMVGLYRR